MGRSLPELESNRLFDEAAADRDAGVLEESDSRLTRGRIFAIGANIGFVVGGLLGALATYNFIKDPIPASTREKRSPVEFDDPYAKKTAKREAQTQRRRVAAERARRRSSFAVGPTFGTNGAGLVLGGSF